MSSSDRQASRTRPAPRELQHYIAVANVLPAPEELPGAEPRDCLPVREHWDYLDRDIERLLDQFPRFREFMNMESADLQAQDVSKVFSRCRSLKEIRSLLYTIARWHADGARSRKIPVGGIFENTLTVSTDEKGNLRIEPFPLVRAIDGVEAARIRECRVCSQIFWAGRIDQICCKTQCAKVLRTRRWRDQYLEKHKLQRIRRANEAEGRSPITARSLLRRPAKG